MLPSKSDSRQRPASSDALSSQRWSQPKKKLEKGTRSLEAPTLHLHEESEHEHASTSEDHLLKQLGMPEVTQTRSRFDKRAKTYRTTAASRPSWENVLARITIDENTGHVMSLEYTKKHMNEKDVCRNLPSVRDIRTLLLQWSPATKIQQLKQLFQTFAAPPVDETKHLTSQFQTVFTDEVSEGQNRSIAIAKE